MQDESLKGIPNPILSVGTQVVTKIEIKNRKGEMQISEGSVGVVIAAPEDSLHSYRVRFSAE